MDISEDDNRLTCWGCKEKFEGSKADALESGWQVLEEELYCEVCVAEQKRK